MNTPYFTLNASKLIDQYEQMQAFADHVNYSAKTNYDAVPLLEKHTRAGFSIHFEHARSHVDDNQRITYYPEGITQDDLSRLAKADITTFVIDNPADLQTLMAWEPPRDDITVYLRLKRKEHSVKTGKHYVFGLASTAVNDAIPSLSEQAWTESLGVHVHRKTQNVAEWRLKNELSDTLSAETLTDLDRLNAGGGFPIRYENYKRNTLPAIKQRFDALNDWAHDHNIKTVIEPGRIIVGPSGDLHTTIINVYDDTVVVDASVFNAAMDTVVANTRLACKQESPDGTTYTVKGRTPDSADIIRYEVSLDNPQPGEILTFENAAAYNYASDFCDLPKPQTKIIDNIEA